MQASHITHDVSRWQRYCRAPLFIAIAMAATWLTGCNGGSSSDATPPPAAMAGLPASASIFDESGQQTGWRHYQYDPNGKLERVVTYDGPGADLQWETADDDVGHWSACTFSSGFWWERWSLAIEYNNVPLEAAARAAWDVLAPREVQCQTGIPYDGGFYEDVTEDIYVGSGPDLAWFTGDDTPDVYRYTAGHGIAPTTSFTWTPTGATGSVRSRVFHYTSPLSPMKVTESSNSVVEFEAWFVKGSGVLGNQYTLRDDGADNVLNNADDKLYLKVTWTYGADGSTTYRYFDGAGTETGYIREKRASTEISSQLESVTTATGAGADGVWRTDDDVLTVVRYQY